MRTFLLAAAATIAIATPAAARDNSGYVGIEGGVLFPDAQHGDFNATFTQTPQSPAAGTTAPLPGTGLVGLLPVALRTPPAAVVGGSRVTWKTGYDVDLIAGYDFGMFRLEGELGYKRSNFKHFTPEGVFQTAVQTGLNPTGTTGTAFVFPAGDDIPFSINNHVTVLSGMINALLDFGGNDGTGGYIGAGFGRAHVKELGESDGAWAYQGIAGVTVPIASHIDIGFKYRYFRTGGLDFDPSGGQHRHRRDGLDQRDLHPHGADHRCVRRSFRVAQPARQPDLQFRRGCRGTAASASASAAAAGCAGDPDLPGRVGDPGDEHLPAAAGSAASAAGRARR